MCEMWLMAMMTPPADGGGHAVELRHRIRNSSPLIGYRITTANRIQNPALGRYRRLTRPPGTSCSDAWQ